MSDLRYYLDTEFNGFGGQLLSLALISSFGDSLYLVNSDPEPLVPWVAENVWTIISDCPVDPVEAPLAEWPYHIAAFMRSVGTDAVIVTDWPDDIRYFCQSVITAPGEMIGIPSLRFSMMRINAYPTRLKGAVQHNAWWDAMALRHQVEGALSGGAA